MNTSENDRFDALWASFRQQVQAARTVLQADKLCNVRSSSEYMPGTAYVHPPRPSYNVASVALTNGIGCSMTTEFTAAELRAHAAHVLASAEMLEDRAARRAENEELTTTEQAA